VKFFREFGIQANLRGFGCRHSGKFQVVTNSEQRRLATPKIRTSHPQIAICICFGALFSL
jgi:hypothetical protein